MTKNENNPCSAHSGHCHQQCWSLAKQCHTQIFSLVEQCTTHEFLIWRKKWKQPKKWRQIQVLSWPQKWRQPTELRWPKKKDDLKNENDLKYEDEWRWTKKWRRRQKFSPTTQQFCLPPSPHFHILRFRVYFSKLIWLWFEASLLRCYDPYYFWGPNYFFSHILIWKRQILDFWLCILV